MLVVKPYNRENAVAYARKYAFSQNSLFANFAGIGGNCTNFVSQCIYAGSCEMNYKPTFGWYFISLDESSPSWSGVEYFYNFIIENTDVGPFGRVATSDELENGDVIQLGRNDEGFYHTCWWLALTERIFLLPPKPTTLMQDLSQPTPTILQDI